MARTQSATKARASIAEMISAAKPPGEKPKSSPLVPPNTPCLLRNRCRPGVTSLKRTSSP